MKEQVIVVGGGMAGLATAKMLSQHYKRVLIIDSGETSQSNHLHVLLKSGQLDLEAIFPGILEKLKAAGCDEVDWSQDTYWENSYGVFPRYESSIKTISMGRQFLEATLRNELKATKNISVIESRMKEVLMKNGRVTGIVISNDEILECAKLILAAGQYFPLERMLGSKVTEKFEEEEIKLTYRSFLFNQGDLELKDFKQYYYQMDPPVSRIGGVICPLEQGMAIATLIEKEEIISECSSFENFLEKSRQMKGDGFYNVLSGAKPVGSLSVMRKHKTHRRILNPGAIPKGVFILGDIVASLNPVFGQGMSLALLQVKLFKKLLEQGKLDEILFHEKCHQLITRSHYLSVIGSREGGVFKKLLRSLMLACQHSQFLHHNFLQYLHFLGQRRRTS